MKDHARRRGELVPFKTGIESSPNFILDGEYASTIYIHTYTDTRVHAIHTRIQIHVYIYGYILIYVYIYGYIHTFKIMITRSD